MSHFMDTISNFSIQTRRKIQKNYFDFIVSIFLYRRLSKKSINGISDIKPLRIN